GEVPQEHVGLGGCFRQALVEVAGEVAGHHAALEVGADLRLGGEVRRGVMIRGQQRLPRDVGDDVEPVGAGEIHGVPGDAAAVDGHAHARRGVVGLLGHGVLRRDLGAGRQPAGAGAEDAIGSGHNTQHFTDASRPDARVVVNATTSARGRRGRRGLIGWPGPVPLPEVPMPAQSPSSPLQTLRTGLWHLRTGGLSQLRTWQRRRRTASYGVGDGTGSLDGAGTLSFPPAKLPDRAPRLPGLRVAVILDDFSMLAWSYEFETVAVTPGSWREQLAEAPVDLLLVESAWHGNKDAWQYQLTGSKA